MANVADDLASTVDWSKVNVPLVRGSVLPSGVPVGPPQAELRTSTPPVSDKLGYLIADTLQGWGVNPQTAMNVGRGAANVAGFVPGLGEGIAAGDTTHALSHGDYPGAAISATGLIIPGAAKVLKGGAKTATTAAKAAEATTGAKLAETIAPEAPAIITRANPTQEDINAIKGAAAEYGRKGWPDATREVFNTSPEAYAETTKLVPQVSIKDKLPGPVEGKPLPEKGRAQQIIDATPQLADQIAERLFPMVKAGDETLKFYHTGPVIRGLENYGDMTIPEANLFMRDWAGQGAATSPRTQTPPNLRNSSYLMHERASGNPLDRARFDREGNTPGFPMMGMHVDLADLFANNRNNPWVNPKPSVFREGWSGNLADVTADTHNIRSTLYEFDRANPGQLHPSWFSSPESYDKYLRNGFLGLDAGDIKDTLGSTAVNKVKRQSEYLPMAEPWYGAAERLGIAPAEAQSGGWFSYGPITGLQSPPKTITNLLNDQIDATARALPGNVPPEKVVDWWSKGKIPLAGVAGTAGLGSVMSGVFDQQEGAQ